MTSTEYEIRDGYLPTVGNDISESTGEQFWEITIGNIDYWSTDRERLEQFFLTAHLMLKALPKSPTAL